MLSPLLSAATGFAAPGMAYAGVKAAPAVQMQATKALLDAMPGKYQTGDIFDPLDLANKYDVNWLREAELKHGRVCMLAIVGWIANDAGIKLPGDELVGVSSLEAHDVTAKTGHLWALLLMVGICEACHMSVVVPRLDGDWGEYKPGNYNLDPFNWASDWTAEAEIKHARLAMLGFGGLATQQALGNALF